jgi:ABC-type branched-subunit amino acid transport system substrate-binding protein
MRKSVAGGIAALAVFCVASAFAQTKEPIRLGLLTSVTGAPANGLAAQLGAQIAIKELNSAGGIDGRQIELVVGDDQNVPTQAAAETRRLVYQEKIAFLLGPSSSLTTLPGIPVLNEAKIGSVSAAGASVLTPEFAPYHFSLLATAGLQATVMANYAQNVLKAKSVAILSDDGTFGKEGGAALKAEIEARKIPIAGIEQIGLQETDVLPQLLKLKRGEPTALLMFSGSGDAIANTRKGMAQLGWSPEFVGNIAATALHRVISASAGEDALKGMVGVMSKVSTWCPGDALNSGPVANFKKKLEAAAPGTRADPLSVIYMYDAVYIFRAAYLGTGGKTDGPTLAKWIEQNSGKLTGLVGGTAEVSPANHFAYGVKSLAMIADFNKPREDGLLRRVDCGS